MHYFWNKKVYSSIRNDVKMNNIIISRMLFMRFPKRFMNFEGLLKSFGQKK